MSIEEDALVAEFFGSDQPDWNSSQGTKVLDLAWRHIVKKTTWLYRFHMADDALDDLCQEVLRKLIENAPLVGFKRTAAMYRWCNVVCKNSFLDHKKNIEKRNDEIGRPAADVNEDCSPSIAIDRAEPDMTVDARIALKDMLDAFRAVERENPVYARILKLDRSRLTDSEKAERMGVSKDNLYHIRMRARKALEKNMDVKVSELLNRPVNRDRKDEKE